MSNEEYQKELMDIWNKEWDRGQRVLVREEKRTFETFVTSEAYMSDGVAMIYLNTDEECRVDVLRAMMPCTYCEHLLAEPFPFETDRGEAVCQHCGEERNMH